MTEEKVLADFIGEQEKLWVSNTKEVKDLSDRIDKYNDPVAKEKMEKIEKDLGDFDKKIQETKLAIDAATAEKKAFEEQIKVLEAQVNRGINGMGSQIPFERKDFAFKEIYERIVDDYNNGCVDARQEAFLKMIRGGVDKGFALTDEEKVLTINDPTTGGYLASPDITNFIIKELREITPVLSIAKVRATTKNQIIVRKKTGTVTARRRGESESKTATTGLAWGIVKIELPEVYAYDDVSEQNIADSDFDLETEIKEEFRDAFEAKIGAEFITGQGSGSNQLEGILTNASVTTKNSSVSNALKADTIVEMVESSLKKQYKRNAQLMFNLSTLGKIRILKDSVGNFLWAPGFETTPAAICGKPYILSEDMSDVASDAYPIFYADYRSLYYVGLRTVVGFKRIVDTVMDAAGTVRISGTWRIGGTLVQPNAGIKYRCHS